MNLVPNQHDNDWMAVLGANPLNFSLTVSAGVSALQQKTGSAMSSCSCLRTQICLHTNRGKAVFL